MLPLLLENIVDLYRTARRRPAATTTVVDTLRSSAAERWTSAKELRTETRSALARRRNSRREAARAIRDALLRQRAALIASLRGRRVAVELWSPGERAPEPTGDRLHAQVLDSIGAHPDGIGALDLGNELGVDWRRVLAVARELVETGMVEQVAEEFYPARRENRT
jgi:hypothetical protein